MNVTLESIQLFYHITLSVTTLLCCSIILSFWAKTPVLSTTSKNGILFAAMIVLTWAFSSMGHLFSRLFPVHSNDARLLESVFRVMSMFNNLFLVLMLPYLGVFKALRNDRHNFSITVIAIVLVMISFILDRVSIGNNNIGKLLVACLDTAFSAPIILLFGVGLSRYCRRAFPSTLGIQIFNWVSIGFLFLLVLGSLAMPLFNLYENQAVVQNFQLVYFFQSPCMFYLLLTLTLISYHMHLQEQQPQYFSEGLNTSIPDRTFTDLTDNPGREALPKSIHFDYLADKQLFHLRLVCQQDGAELSYVWTGPNCIYPFFYWLYLSVALKHQIEVEIKDSQVNRNRMLRMFDKNLNPRFFIQLNGGKASLNLEAEQIFIDRDLIQHNAVKAKFKENIEPFLALTSYDRKQYEQDWSYTNVVFEDIYKLLFQ